MSGKLGFFVTASELTAELRHPVPIHTHGNARCTLSEINAYFVRYSSPDFQKLFYRDGRSLPLQMDQQMLPEASMAMRSLHRVRQLQKYNVSEYCFWLRI